MKYEGIGIKLISVLIIGSLGVTGCSKKSPSQEPAPETSETGAPGFFAFCNQKSGATYENSVKAYVTSSNTVATDWMLAKVGKVPSSFATDGSFIQFFKWKTDANGTVSIDTTPLRFLVEQIASRNVLISGYNHIKWDHVSAASEGQSPTDFFNSVRFVIYLRDPSLDYQGIKMVVYKADSSVADQVDLLMPVFDADPDDYAITPSGMDRPAILQNLHPFKVLQGQGLSKEEFKNLAKGYCF